MVFAEIFDDKSILDVDELSVGEILSDRTIKATIFDIADILDECVGKIVDVATGTDAQSDLSVILAGKESGKARIIGWSDGTGWKRHEHDITNGLGWMTMPPDGIQYRNDVASILNDRRGSMPSYIKIRRAVGYLSRMGVETVGNSVEVHSFL